MFRIGCCLMASFCLVELAAAQQPPAPGAQTEQVMKDREGDLGYLLYLPRSYEEKAEKRWPLILFLHGSGERSGPLSVVAKWGPPRFASRGDDLPYILVSPQCPVDASWSEETQLAQLGRLLAKVMQELHVDATRVYLTGLSMGGEGTWTLAAKHPDRFAAVVPICGRGDPADADQLKELPIWVFHGDQDSSVPLSESAVMVDAIQARGGKKIRFTTLEHVGHNSWSAAYALPELYEWMFQHQAKSPIHP